MSNLIVLALLLFIVAYLTYGYYQPKIEVVLLYKKKRVFLWYNQWDGPKHKRVYKPLFDI